MASHPAHHRSTSPRERRALAGALGVTAVLFLAEVVGGLLSGSLALLSDAAHMLTDLLALGLARLALGFASRPATPRRSFGYYRLEILSALANGILLTMLAGGILLEAANRFGNPPVIRVDILLPVAAAGLLANLISLIWLRRARGGLVTRAAVWHTASDTIGSFLVLVTAGLLAAGLPGWLDAAASVLLALFMVWGAWRLLRDAIHVLLESTPRDLDLDAVAELIRGVDGVEGIHDLHVWSLTSGVHALSGHLRVRPERLEETDRIIVAARSRLEGTFGIAHTTLQVESEQCGEVVCVLGPRTGRERTENR